MRKSALMAVAALWVAAGTTKAQTGRPAEPVKRPNILLILADDLGYADVSFNVRSGTPEIPTPNLDKLARAGTIMTAGYVAHPFCGPSRAAIMTGRYPHEIGASYNLPDDNEFRHQGVTTNETFISTVLHDAGYFTGIIGKWHLGQDHEYCPNARGFDEFYGFLGGGHNYFGPFVPQNAARSIWQYRILLKHNWADVPATNNLPYLTDDLTEHAVDFLNAAVGKKQPFFLYLAYNAPHTPLQAKESDLAMFPNLTGKRKTYAAMVYDMDRGVGEVVKALKANGQFDNTLIVFLSDNGGRTDEGASNYPLQGKKGDTWEGGFRVPMFWEWPKVIPSGKLYNYPVDSLDFYPTFAHLADAKIPAGKKLDGKDVLADVIADRNARPGQPIYALRYRIGFKQDGTTDVGIRDNQWKAVKIYGMHWKLFNITNDIGETTDLSSQYPEILQGMVSKAKVWSQGFVTPQWYDSYKAEQEWKSRGMPHYDETFSLH